MSPRADRVSGLRVAHARSLLPALDLVFCLENSRDRSASGPLYRTIRWLSGSGGGRPGTEVAFRTPSAPRRRRHFTRHRTRTQPTCARAAAPSTGRSCLAPRRVALSAIWLTDSSPLAYSTVASPAARPAQVCRGTATRQPPAPSRVRRHRAHASPHAATGRRRSPPPRLSARAFTAATTRALRSRRRRRRPAPSSRCAPCPCRRAPPSSTTRTCGTARR